MGETPASATHTSPSPSRALPTSSEGLALCVSAWPPGLLGIPEWVEALQGVEDGLQHPGPSSPERRNYGVSETRSQAGEMIIIEEF